MNVLLRFLTVALLFAAVASRAGDDAGAIVVIAHPSVGHLDLSTLQRLYTGRAVEVAGTHVSVVNLVPDNPARERFLTQILGEDDEKFVAYWTVRRHVGKGTPPREFKSAAEVIEFVQATPGAIGYIPVAALKPGLNVVLRP